MKRRKTTRPAVDFETDARIYRQTETFDEPPEPLPRWYRDYVAGIMDRADNPERDVWWFA